MAMTVKQLIERLQECDDPDMEVVFAYDYGDHWHSTVCQPVRELDEGAKIVRSEYHRMDKLVKESWDEDDGDERPGERRVVVLK